MLPGDGRVVTCTPDNEHADLFFGFPNSYGTLGYALRLKARTMPVKPYVQLAHLALRGRRATSRRSAACDAATPTFVDGVGVRARTRSYITLGALRRHRAVHQRLHLRAASTTARSASARRLPDGARLSLALGHRLVLVLEERRRAEPLRAQALRPGAARLAHLPEDHALEQPLEHDHGSSALLGLHSESVIQDVDIPVRRAAEFLTFFAARDRHRAAVDLPDRAPPAAGRFRCIRWRRAGTSISASGT